MPTPSSHLKQDQAADYVFDYLPEAEQAAFEKAMESEAALRLEVKELSAAAAAISLTARQAKHPQAVQIRFDKQTGAEKDEPSAQHGTDAIV